MFKTDEDMNRADWPLLQNGAINLFWRPEILNEAQRALGLLGYEIAEISGRSGWSGFRTQMSFTLRWDEQFGYASWTGNMNALNDGLRGYPFGVSHRNALVIRDFDILVEEDREGSRILLDLLETTARDHLLWGKTLVVLIHTNDNRYDSGPVGGRSAHWNQREWMDASRCL